jgi:DNA-directed RNA polymerase subunit RPC12/RpoP
MNCLRCGREISDSFFTLLNQSPEFKGGRFACPHCGAEHLRREVGTLPTGAPLFTVRLWGHLRAPREPVSASVAGKDRRKAARSRSWR